MADVDLKEHEERIIVDRTVAASMGEIMNAAYKLRPDDDFSYSDVICMLFEIASHHYDPEDLPAMLLPAR